MRELNDIFVYNVGGTSTNLINFRQLFFLNSNLFVVAYLSSNYNVSNFFIWFSIKF